jgi:DNA mismatch repair ATPase MutS
MSLAVVGQTRENCCFPELLTESAPRLQARDLQHLLLDEAQGVPNDIEVRSETRIITGSNMSGKTTFLRTLASSVVLAWAGAPVCAAQFGLTRLHVFTSIRVTDDITKGLSTFYAELLRIKSMVEFAKKKTPMLICIDEIFKGTNSADRIIGARAAIERLTGPQNITLVSTHDFELCDLLSPNDTPVTNYHFAETYDVEGHIHFDFRLQPGRCQTTNAKYLLRLAGILDE